MSDSADEIFAPISDTRTAIADFESLEQKIREVLPLIRSISPSATMLLSLGLHELNKYSQLRNGCILPFCRTQF